MYQRQYYLLLFFLALGVMNPARAQGQEVKWWRDYNAAIKEAEEKSLPLLLDFGTTHCLYCDKMDETTFRNSKVAGLINERFVALKINAEHEPKLAQMLGIDKYPTFVFAGPDKKILGKVEGYKEAEEFLETLQRTLAGVSNPDWMVREYHQAVKWMAKKEYAPAISALRRIVEDGKGRPVQASAQKLLSEMEQQGREKLTKAKQLQEKGQTSQAILILTETMREFPGLMLTREAGEMLSKLAQNPEVKNQQRASVAQDLLKQAKELYKNKEYTLCIDRCSKLMTTYGDLNEGQEASNLYGEIKNNPEWLQNACDTFSDRLAEMYLLLAESWLKRGNPQQAKHWLDRVIRAFPGTRHAESAQIRLEQLDGSPTRRVDFETP